MYDLLTGGRIKYKIAQISAMSADISGTLIIHDIRKLAIVYMSPEGCDDLGLNLEEIKRLSIEEYHQRFFNPEDASYYVPKIMDLLERNTDETFTFFQQVRTIHSLDWRWYMSSVKILLRDEKNKPLLTLTISFPVNNIPQVTAKAKRLLDENDFLRKHSLEYSKLGKRESEILKLIAMGKSSVEIGEELCISSATADTHRKNIKLKLKTNSFYELCLYARAFDLI